MKNSFIINGTLLLGSIIGFFLVIEFGLRVTGLQTVKPNPPQIYQNSNNPDIGYELKPNLKNEKAYKARVSTDEHGLRKNGELLITDYKSLITVLGDSITFGYGVDDNETLSSQLSSLSSSDQFINAAVPGYQLTQETQRYIEKIQPMHPDGVILVFFWNDLDGFLPGFLDEEGILRPHGWEPSDTPCSGITTGIMNLIPGKCWLDTHSAFYKAFKKVVDLKASKKRQETERAQAPALQHETESIEEALQEYGKNLQGLSSYLPPSRTFVIWPDNVLHTEARIALSAMVQQYGFTVIDLYDVFGNTVETLSWDTVHPSPTAIKRAAQFIFVKWKENVETCLPTGKC